MVFSPAQAIEWGAQEIYSTTSPKPHLPITIPRIWFDHTPTAEAKWCDIETAQGTYTSTSLDASVANYVAQGHTKIIYVIGAVPGWANGTTPSGCSASNYGIPPTSAQYLYDFVTWLVPHLKAQCSTCQFIYELWNEPTVTSFWNSSDTSSNSVIGATMAAYIPNLSSIIRANDTNALIASPSPVGFNKNVWMDSFLAAGLAADVDIIAFHAYPATPTPYSNFPEQLHDTDTVTQEQLAAYGVSKPIWWTEGSYSNSITDLPTQLGWAAKYNLFALCDGIGYANWYGWDVTTAWGQLWDGIASPHNGYNRVGQYYRNTIGWLNGATCSTPIARTANANGVRNPTGTGLVAGTPGTAPTNWTASNGDLSHGITTALGSGISNGVPYVSWHVYGTYTGGGSGYVQLRYETSTQVAASPGQLWTTAADYQLAPGSSLANVNVISALNLFTSGGSYITALNYHIYPESGLSVDKQLYSFTNQIPAGSTAFVQPMMSITYTASNPIDVTIYVAAPSADNGTVWTAGLTQNGVTKQVAWDMAGGPTAFSTTASWARTPQNDSSPVVGSSVNLTNMPLLLEPSAWKALIP